MSRWSNVSDLLVPREIQAGLSTRWLGHRVYYRHTLDSTNDLAKQLASRGEPQGTIVVAEGQTRGRGRQGREWFSPPGQGLLFSIILRPPWAPYRAPQIVFWAAVALAETLKDYGLVAGIKWPNDVQIQGKKVAGILSEMVAQSEQIEYVVVGIGLNVNTDLKLLPLGLAIGATSLRAQLGFAINRVQLLQRFLEQLEEEYDTLCSQGFQTIREKWRRLAVVLGQQVEGVTAAGSFFGRAEDIDDEGALLVITPGGARRRVLAGDVSLRLW